MDGSVARFYNSTIGKKVVMAVTGLVLVLFVLGHMAGNLKMFAGYDVSGVHAMDAYAEMLRSIGADILGKENFLWIARAVLLLCVVLHFASAFQLAKLNRAARPVGYKIERYRSSNAASRTMLYGGVLVLIFIVFHILHFTTGTLHFDGFQHGKVYSNVHSGFQVWPVALFYIVTMAALGAHLFHGIWSLCQTLGVDTPKWNLGIRRAALVISVGVFLGFSAVPLSVVFGVLPQPRNVVSIQQVGELPPTATPAVK
jgi:succinate dehydrogenase / fumarate reductase cytochrome b subunit